jgi:ectoine hydroxylase-related dioxygenase (phytanoyl-CoA dioxygenase family)
MAEANAASRLTQDQIAVFRKDGYIQYRQPVFSPEKFASLKEIFEENLLKYGPDDLDTIHFRDERLMEFLFAPEVISLVEPLIGPNIGLWSSHFICKPAGVGKATPWHEDSSYWNGRLSSMADIITVWLAMDNVFPENGSMGVIPGTHVNGFSDYEDVDGGSNIFTSQVKGVDESQAVFFTLDAGECSLHDSRIIHGAHANTSPYRRAGYTMRYFPASSKVMRDHPGNQGFKVWLVKGENLGGTDFVNA